MKKQLVIIGIIALCVSVGLSGCNSSEQTSEDIIIGKWSTVYQNTSIEFTFYKNDSVYAIVGVQSGWAEYEITKDHILLINSTTGQTTTAAYSFTDNNQKLILKNLGAIEELVLTKQ